MSDYREIKIIVNVIGKGNLMTDERGGMVSGMINIAVSELATIDAVMEEVKKRILAIEDVHGWTLLNPIGFKVVRADE